MEHRVGNAANLGIKFLEHRVGNAANLGIIFLEHRVGNAANLGIKFLKHRVGNAANLGIIFLEHSVGNAANFVHSCQHSRKVKIKIIRTVYSILCNYEHNTFSVCCVRHPKRDSVTRFLTPVFP